MASYYSQSVVFGSDFMATVLDALSAAPEVALIVTPKVRLSQSPTFNPVPTMTRAGLAADEADFSGYTAGGYTPTLSANVVLQSGVVGKVANVLPVMATADPLVQNSVYGWWLDDGANVICAERFADGLIVQFAEVGDFLDLLIAVPMQLTQLAMLAG